MTFNQALDALENVDKRVKRLSEKMAGDKLEKVLETATLLIVEQNKSATRALADALEQFKLA